MMILLWVYLGGVALRAFLCHGISQNPTVNKINLDQQVLGCIGWPLSLLTVFVK